MIIQELQLKAFGKFHNKTLPLQNTMNVIEGQNEAGKSTIHAFIGAMLFGLDKDGEGKKVYKKYKPWLDPSGFGGAMKLEEDGRVYYIERNFAEQSVSVTQVGSGDTVSGEAAEAYISEILGGLTANGYANTVSIDQMKGTTDESIAAELKGNLDNLSRARSLSLNFGAVEEELNKKRGEIEAEMSGFNIAMLETERKELAEKKDQLDKQISDSWEIRAEFVAAMRDKKEAFDRYQEKRSMQSAKCEMIDRERAEIVSQQELWEKTDINTQNQILKLKPKADRLAVAGKDPVKAYGPKLWIWICLIIVLGLGAATFAAQYILEKYIDIGYTVFPEKSMTLQTYLILAGGLAALMLVAVFVAVGLSMNFSKRKNYYRMLLDRAGRQNEYEAAKNELEKDRMAILSEMASEQNGEYMSACERCDIAEKSWMQAKWDMQQRLDAYDECVRRNTENEKRAVRYNDCRKELAAVDLAWEHIYKAGEQSIKTFGHDLVIAAGNYMSKITSGKYTGLTTSEEGDILLTSLEGDVPVTSVSRGTMEQVYLVIRLAATELLSPRVKLPIILDDTFAYYDDARTEQALKLLKNYGHQVVIMTCQSREKKILKSAVD